MTLNAAETGPVALVTARAARAHDADLPLLASALGARGLAAEIVAWDASDVDWSRFALALLRSTWDYATRLPEFLNWLDRVAQLTRVVNPCHVVRWNLDKHYLAELRRSGVATVPTAYADTGDDPALVLANFLQSHAAAELVLKPAVGSGSRDAQRYARAETPAMLAHMRRLLAERRSVMLQPYLERIDELGETALIYIDGEFSHAIRKAAVLRRGHGPTQALFAPEAITGRSPTADELVLGTRVLQQLPFAELLYARIDLVRDTDGAPCVLELELAEPSLYLAYAPGAAARLAAAVVSLIQSRARAAEAGAP